MSTPTNHWKLGLFVVVGFVLSGTTVFYLGARSLKKEVVSYQTFYDESVQGLEVGSSVKFRGVTIGNVSAIGVAPDGRHVDVTSDLAVKDLTELGLGEGIGKSARIRVPPDLRAQLASQGITGVKFLQVDFFDVKDNPVPVLPFPVPENYLPAAVSTMKNLEDAVVRAVDRLPEVATNIAKVTDQISRLLDDVESKKLPENAALTIKQANNILDDLQKTVKQLNAGRLSSEAQKALANLNTTIVRANAMIEHIDGDKGLLASAERASGAVGDVAAGARGVGQELGETLRDIQEVTASIQRVADALERDPDMLLKGRSRSK
jgi:phospholipid/cholesterol/gamma-HCH transport system substrate-binding protein